VARNNPSIPYPEPAELFESRSCQTAELTSRIMQREAKEQVRLR
jgi:hypothetical protein